MVLNKRLIFFFCGMITSFSLSAKKLCLTFDDFPMPDGAIYKSEERLDRMLEVLDAHKISATFFCIGSSCNQNLATKLLNKLSLHKQIIANHSLKHIHASTLTDLEFEKDLLDTDKLLKGFSTFNKWYRYPYLDYGDRCHLGGNAKKQGSLRKILNKHGYKDGFVTINTFDWYVNHKLRLALVQGQRVDYHALKTIYLDLLSQWINFYEKLYSHDFDQKSFCHSLLFHANDINALFLTDIISMIKKLGWDISHSQEAFTQKLSNHQLCKLNEFRLKLAPSMTQDAIDRAFEDNNVFRSCDNDQDALSSR